MPRQTVTHGGPMTPHTPPGKVPMQEWPAYVIVDEKGNAFRHTFAAAPLGAVHAYVGLDPEDSTMRPDQAAAWADAVETGFRVARVAVVEDA